MSKHLTRKRAAIVAAGAAIALVPAAAHAAPEDVITFKYDANGTTNIKKPNTNIALKNTTLTADLDVSNGNFTGTLPLPKTSTEFKALGFAPTKADVSFIPVGRVTGNVDFSGTQAKVTATARYTVQLTNIKIFGFPTFPGNNCKTVTPATIPVATPANEGFDLTTGGNLTGTYTLPQFKDCGINTGIVNGLVPGPGNTVKFTVSNGRS